MGKSLYQEVRRAKRIEAAWKRVRDNGRKSRSKRTRHEIEEFDADIHTHLRSIQGQLVRDSFRFSPARGWAEPPKEPGKKHRPIVITPVPSRIVQRSILDLLLEQTGIDDYISQPFSFGGIAKKDPDAETAVPGAIKAAVAHILDGNKFFIRSDISGFFRNIPKTLVMEKIRDRISDDKFCQLIQQSMSVELHNLDELRQHVDLFPLEDLGVAQGCALSPLFGNILLSDFDRDLNSGACRCIRYIDDFLIVGPSEEAVKDCFAQALEHLNAFKMDAYDPEKRRDKAETGNVDIEQVTFLGVEIQNGSIRPSAKNRGKLISSINEIIHDNTKVIPHETPKKIWEYNRSFLRCLFTINSVVSGWGNQYYFCNDRIIIDHIDQKISDMLTKASGDFRALLEGLGHLGRRRLIGVKSLHDCKVEPIVWKSGTPAKAS